MYENLGGHHAARKSSGQQTCSGMSHRVDILGFVGNTVSVPLLTPPC